MVWRVLLAGLAMLALSAAPARAAVGTEPHVDVGLGENTMAAFDDPRFAATGIRHVRLIVPYDVVLAGGERLAETDAWLEEARLRGFEPLVSFGYSAWPEERWRLPSQAEYGARVREFRERYPWVREYATWNEANHKAIQPTGGFPAHTARLYRELRRQCAWAGCRAVAADLLLTGTRRTWRWIRTFRRAAGPGPHVWGLHNYPDANRRSSRRTRRFLRTIPGEVWFTETGGIVKFGRRWRRDERRADRAVRYVFGMARLSPRITRLYLYHWREAVANRRWDSGLIAAGGRSRPAYFTLLRLLGQERFRPIPPITPREPAGS